MSHYDPASGGCALAIIAAAVGLLLPVLAAVSAVVT